MFQVYELETEAVADHICGQNRHFSQQPYKLSANNVVYVKFVSDDGVTGAGFKLFYVQGKICYCIVY